MNIVLLGLPGSGKGTQGELLEKNHSFKKLSTGDLLRLAVKNSTDIGLKVEKILSSGGLVSDEIMNELVKEFIDNNIGKYFGFVFDGYPRTIKQAKFLDDCLLSHLQSVDKVLFFKVDKDVVIDRIVHRYTCAKCGAGYNKKFKNPIISNVCDVCGSKEFSERNDDSEKIALKRVDEYENETSKLVQFYRQNGILEELDGSMKIEDLTNEINFIVKDSNLS